jgi:hypothetical protein
MPGFVFNSYEALIWRSRWVVVLTQTGKTPDDVGSDGLDLYGVAWISNQELLGACRT